jgi:hypothetical protein
VVVGLSLPYLPTPLPPSPPLLLPLPRYHRSNPVVLGGEGVAVGVRGGEGSGWVGWGSGVTG